MAQELSKQEKEEFLQLLNKRFEKNMNRHSGLTWDSIHKKLSANGKKLWSLFQMEKTGGEPDVVGFDQQTGTFVFYDCSVESPSGRRSCCYDDEALDARKENKPAYSAIGLAQTMGIDILTENEYRTLQTIGKFDLKTSSWVKTPDEIRKLGGAIFCDRRYNQVFMYHNGVQSYYAARAFRGKIMI